MDFILNLILLFDSRIFLLTKSNKNKQKLIDFLESKKKKNFFFLLRLHKKNNF